MRILWAILILAPILLVTSALVRCGPPGLERVDVQWATDPPPTWGLYPGYRQEIPFKKGSSYNITVYSEGKNVTGGTVAEVGSGLGFRPTAGARDIEAEIIDRDHLRLFVTLKDDKGQGRRLPALTVERKGEKMYFEFPK